jgi:hypothetical protein
MSVLAAFGIVDRAPLQVSDALRQLNMSHTYAWRDGVRYCSTDINGLCREQPVWPIIVDSLRTLSKMQVKGPYVYLVVDSRAALATTNLGTYLWPEKRDHTFLTSLRDALVIAAGRPDDWKLAVNEPSLMDYVNTATKPSQLTDIQSLLFKISNYPLRKEVKTLCISYLAGTASLSAVKAKLNSNLKLAPLLTVMLDDRTKRLKDAVAMLKTTHIDKVVKETGIQSFELLYVMKSAAGAQEEQARLGKAGKKKKSGA